MEQSYDTALKLLVSLAIGLLIGIERGWSEREEDEGDRIAGIRTFSLIGLMGGVVALFSREVGHWLIVAAFIAVSALIITAHILDVREDMDVGTTTAFTMMLTFILAAWAAYGHTIPATAVTVIVISLLGLKSVLHSWLKKDQTAGLFFRRQAADHLRGPSSAVAESRLRAVGGFESLLDLVDGGPDFRPFLSGIRGYSNRRRKEGNDRDSRCRSDGLIDRDYHQHGAICKGTERQDPVCRLRPAGLDHHVPAGHDRGLCCVSRPAASALDSPGRHAGRTALRPCLVMASA